MRYKVTDKRIEFNRKDESPVHKFQLEGSVWMWFPVSADDFQRVRIGDTIEMLVSIVPTPKPPAA
jgi:hypothetical protein